MITDDERAAHHTRLLRRSLGAGKLDPAVAALMNDLDPLWAASASDVRFRAGLTVLDTYIDQVGNGRPPARHVESDYPLGAWVAARRADRKAGRLDPARIAALEQRAGWVWAQHDADFEEGLAVLRVYIETHGHPRPPADAVRDGVRLGRWVVKQRAKRVTGDLSETRVAKLEALPGWVWSARAALFADRLEALDAYVCREGTAAVVTGHNENGINLGAWVNGLRSSYGKGTLPAGVAEQLEARAGWTWNARAHRFELGLAALDTFIARERNCRISSEHVENGHALGNWVYGKRAEYRHGKLSAERVAALEARFGWYWGSAAA